MTEKEVKHTSKFLSLILRHQPGQIDLTLDTNGWAAVNVLLEKLNIYGTPLTLAQLEHIVHTNNKKRFAFNEDGTKIRASQGHSIAVELDLSPSLPPPILYHGTAQQYITAIQKDGLRPMQRQHVHLSADKATASMVGSRHGKPVIIEVKAEEMFQDGYVFYLSANNVWLTDAVPPAYLCY